MLNTLFSHKLIAEFNAQDIAKIMICVKLSRSVWSDKRDHFVDMAGYAACGYECISLAAARPNAESPSKSFVLPDGTEVLDDVQILE